MNSIKSPNRYFAYITALLTTLFAGLATAGDRTVGNPLNYDDLDGFATAITEIDAGSPSLEALQRYINGASPGMQIYTQRFGASAETIAARRASYPNFYRYLTSLRPEIEAREMDIQRAISALQANAPAGSMPVPIYFLVANMRAGGSPGLVQTPEGPQPAIAIAIELMALSDRVDHAEFPGKPPGVNLTDLPTVVAHEMTHIFQMQAQGLNNYRSLYFDPARMTNLAFAVREGCADFLVWKAVGWEFEDRNQFVREHADDLWVEFAPILHEPVDPSASWFGPAHEDQPERPMQLGYGIGMQICEAYYAAAADKSQALEQVYRAYLAEHFETILAPYAKRMLRR